ncbi:MAG: hypothetical protein IJC16_06065 [Rikenellaceae bacterium]|nr:hypothetical protein [Rikenellaceae bacterium]
MSNALFIFLIAVGVVAFFILALSLTLIFKGHHIQSEIGDNPHMQKRGIKCAAQQMRAEETLARGECDSVAGCDAQSCSTCSEHDCKR